jgi:hypothetical protein
MTLIYSFDKVKAENDDGMGEKLLQYTQELKKRGRRGKASRHVSGGCDLLI